MGFASSRTIRKSVLLFLVLIGCSGMEHSEREKIRRLNCKGEAIYRNHDELFYPIPPLVHSPRPLYPWESEMRFPQITKEFFRCKGNPFNQEREDPGDPEKRLLDCQGNHGLPILRGKETVSPILVDLLNYVQKKTGKRVVITCGHRCPMHNTYADPSKENQVSKHQIGAEVDFYVQGMEESPQEVVGLLMQYFQEQPGYGKETKEFRRAKAKDTATEPWYNRDVFIKLYQKEEGRDADNHHPYAYLSIQVRYDPELKERVEYSWAKAHQGYPR